uniref:Uncharacterized protein n=1 Tax=Timema monikensis TaxID=170555 RepID=A0A7R9EG77_9NEOP|nr:unnamed protein product [Timema monikensis]
MLWGMAKEELMTSCTWRSCDQLATMCNVVGYGQGGANHELYLEELRPAGHTVAFLPDYYYWFNSQAVTRLCVCGGFTVATTFLRTHSATSEPVPSSLKLLCPR